jgi:sugar/nucleoside kinase (ribokinase family)
MIVCLGEGLVDLICERPGASITDADCFTPYFGGALANVAVAAARAGAKASLAGAAGDDEWGRWLARRLEDEGVDISHFELLEGEQTPIAFAAFDTQASPTFVIYGDAIEIAVSAVGPRLESALASATALVYSSTTLATQAEREVTLRARELALEAGTRVCLDPNIRPNRWGGRVEPAAEASRELIAGSYLVRTNLEESRAITGADDPREAAAELAALGAELAVVTMGADGAVIRGACEVEMTAPQVEVVSTLGAGDVFMGTLVAGLAACDWDASRAGEALGPALDAAAEVCARWSALG